MAESTMLIERIIAACIPLKTVSYREGYAQTSTTAEIYLHAIRTADEKAAEVLDGIPNTNDIA